MDLHPDSDPDSDPDPTIFAIDLLDGIKKLIKKRRVSCSLLFEGTFTSFYKDIKSKRSHKTVGIKVFPTFSLLDDRRIRIRIHTSD
jgi:hypothetical protein